MSKRKTHIYSSVYIMILLNFVHPYIHSLYYYDVTRMLVLENQRICLCNIIKTIPLYAIRKYLTRIYIRHET